MQDTALALAIGAGTVLALGVASGYVKNRLWISEPIICLLIGILVGPAGLDLFSLDATATPDGTALKEVARVTLAISIMGAALRLPHDYVARHWRELAVVLGLGMPLMWAAGTLLTWLLLPVPLLVAALVGAVLAPVDPVLCDTVVAGRIARDSLPGRLGHGLTAEGAANDGLGLLFVMLPVLLLTESAGPALGKWLTLVLAWEILGAVALGALAGWLAGRCLDWTMRQPLHEPVSALTVSVALALTVLAGLRLIHSDGILGVFAAGVVFNGYLKRIEMPEHEHIPEAIGRFFDLPVFILFGIALPWQRWLDVGWPILALPLAVLALRRLPAWLLLRRWLPSLQSRRETLFNGWFGPVGIAAVFYALRAHEDTGNGMVWPAASAVVLASILAHGVTATPLAARLRARARTRGGADAGEAASG